MLKEDRFDAPVELRTCDTPERAAAFWRVCVDPSARFTPGAENLVVLFLNTRRNIIGFQITSTGTLDTLLVHAREVFRAAIIEGASAILLMHNHPSGDPTPSEADVRITRELVNGGKLLRIDVVDHVIMGSPSPERPHGYASLRELGYFYN